MKRSGVDRSIYQEDNEILEEQLRNKVSSLRSLSISIGDEVRDQNRLLNDMDDDMGKIGGFLGTTVARLKRLSRQGYGKLYLYLALFSLAVFFVMYILIRFS